LSSRIHKTPHDNDAAGQELCKLLDSVHSRRSFLKGMGLGMGYAALTACGSSGDDSSGTPPVEEVPETPITLPAASAEYNALKRTSFGVHRDSLSAMKSIGIDAYLENQLDYKSINDGDLESTIANLFPLSTQTPVDLINGTPGYPAFPDNIALVALDMARATQYRQIFSQRQLYEVMVEFWSDHFNIHLLNGFGPVLKPDDDRNIIREHALGNFRDLLGASASSPSMLFYLDNFLNVGGAPNENYARELMELHTLGVDGGYNEDDVKEVARCFTGWSISFGDGSFVYNSADHDTGGKLVLGNSIASGGQQTDGVQVLDILAAHPSTAQFIATKLCRRFISDTPDSATVNAVASAFSTSNGDIKTTLRALFASDAFKNSADLKFTRPSEYLAGVIRAIAPDTTYPTDDGMLFFYARLIMGQAPFYWPTPDGYPDEQSYWANTGGLLNRWRMSFLSYAPYIPEINFFQIDYASLTNNADTIAGILDALVDNVLMRPLSAEDRSSMIEWMVSEAGYAEDDPLPAGVPETYAPLVMAVLISSAYFQLR
jgi:Protein of unknown function (DUF1800)